MVVQIITAVTAMVKLANTIKEYNETDSSEEVLERIELMQEALSNQLDQIGQAITELTGIIEEEFDALKLETAISLAQTAMNMLYTYRDLGLENALTEADATSSQAVELLKQQDEVYFIGGLLLAGNVRIDVIRALDPGFATDEWRVQEINALASHLESLIQKIEQKVPTYHRVIQWENIVSIEDLIGERFNEPGMTPPPPRVTQEMAHRSSGQIVNSYPFSCSGAGCTLTYIYSREEATHLANESRSQGIAAELASLGVPEMREVHSVWRNLITWQLNGYTLWKFLGRKANVLDAQRADRPYFSATREPVRRNARESEGKPQYEMVLNVDARPFIVDLLTSLEFKTRTLEKLDREGIYNELIQQMFSRKPDKDEIVMLRRMEDEVGFDGLVAGLVYGKEYAESYGTGVPMMRKAATPGRKTTTSKKRTKETLAEA